MTYKEDVKVFYIKFNGNDESFNKFLSKMVVDFNDFPQNITDFYLWFSEKYSKSIIPPTFRILVSSNHFDFIAVYDKEILFDEKEIKSKLIMLNIPYLQCSYGYGDIHFNEKNEDCCMVNANCLCKIHPIFYNKVYDNVVHTMTGDSIINAIKNKQFII